MTQMIEKTMVKDELYNSQKVVIPTPKFVVFYNGSRRQPERSTLYLSDLYAQKEGKENLELRVLQLNISKGFNEDLKKKCPTLMGYNAVCGKGKKLYWNDVLARSRGAVNRRVHRGRYISFIFSKKPSGGDSCEYYTI